MLKLEQTETFKKWRISLRDVKVRAKIASRLDQLAFGLAGDVRPIGEGISELRFHFGAGYRIYFSKEATRSLSSSVVLM